MIFVTYGELEIQAGVLSASDKSIANVVNSRSLQELVNDTSILISLSTGHLLVHLSLFKVKNTQKAMDFGNLVAF